MKGNIELEEKRRKREITNEKVAVEMIEELKTGGRNEKCEKKHSKPKSKPYRLQIQQNKISLKIDAIKMCVEM